MSLDDFVENVYLPRMKATLRKTAAAAGAACGAHQVGAPQELRVTAPALSGCDQRFFERLHSCLQLSDEGEEVQNIRV